MRTKFRLTPAGLIGLTILVCVVLAAVLAPWISPFDPLQQEIRARLQPPMTVGLSGDLHILGTDQLGRDVLSRLIYGSRVSLIVGIVAVSLSATIGSLIGVISAYRLGLTDEILMRIADIQLAIPFILLALAVLSVLGASLVNIIIVLGITGWVNYAKVVRGQALSVRQRDYVLAAVAGGASHGRVILRHILPNVSATIIVLASLYMPQMVLAEAGISFLGLGIQPPTPSWGNMLSEGREYVWTAWWLSTFSGVAISLTVLGANLAGDWLRDLLDPRLRNIV